MKKFIVAFLKDEEGLTMVEYAIAGALVSIACVTCFTALERQLRENQRPRNGSKI
jgi:pilus assembly protein Flp/PilA